MPPSSSSLRRSSGKDPRGGNHKRGRSLEGGLLSQAKNDDLALFNKVENRAKDNFSLYSLDSFDELSSSRLQRLSKIKLGISIPVQEKNNGLLDADDEKNEYDWLLTPPDTPLFPSLEYETPQVNHAHRGKSRGQTVSIPRLASAEKSNRTIRGSSTPQRLNPSTKSNRTNKGSTREHRRSPSPQSRNGTFQSRGRQSSVPHSSPPLHSRSTTPSRRMSTLPSKSSAPGSRFSTPTSQRTSIVSSGMASFGKRGTSPVNKSPRNSGSSKVQQDWDSVPGFSMDVPPNLRTSLSSRPVSHGRGSSPASRNGTSSSTLERQSMSPNASRSPRSLHSFGRDQCNHQNKESVVSSSNDHIESPLSTIISILDHVEARKAGLVPKRGPSVFPMKSSLTTLDPTRSADTALMQTGQKSPQSMFTPFPSSVPNATGKENSGYNSMISNNSLATTSCIISSEQGQSFVVDISGTTNHDPDDHMVIERGLTAYTEAQGEVFTLNEAYEKNNEQHENPDEKSSVAHHEFDTHSTDEIDAGLTRFFDLKCVAPEITVTEPAYVANSILGVDYYESTPTCSKCSKKLCATRLMERNGYVYLDCSEGDECVTMGSLETTVVCTQNSTSRSELTPEEHRSYDNRSYDKLEPRIDLQGNASGSASMLCRSETMEEQGKSGMDDISPVKMVEEEEQWFANQRMLGQPTGSTQHELEIGHSSIISNVAEAAGISVLPNVSNSSRWPVVQGRTSVATNIPSDDPSYARDDLSSASSSAGPNSISAASSVNLSLPCSQYQLSGKEVDVENYQHDLNTTHHSCRSSFPEISNHSYEVPVLAISSDEENLGPYGNEEIKSLEESVVAEGHGITLNYTGSDDRSSSHIEADFLKVNEICHTENCGIPCNSALVSKKTSIQLDRTSIQKLSNNGCISFDNALNLSDEEKSFSDLERPDMISKSDSTEEDNVVDLVNDQTPRSLVLASEDLRNGCDSSPGPQRANLDCPNPESIISDQDCSASITSQNKTSVSPSKSHISGHTHRILEEPTVTLEVPGGHIRSLTLEEIADSTLFCRSIIQKIAYQATTIAVEKENHVCLEGLHPMVTTVGRPSSSRKDFRARTSSRHAMKILKAKCCVERNGMTTSPTTETSIKSNKPLKHDSMALRKVNKKWLPKLGSKSNCAVM